MHEEELHLQLGDPAAQALSGSETETQPLEGFGASCQPALGAELLWLGEDLSVPTHGVQTDLHQRLRGRMCPIGLGSPRSFTGAQSEGPALDEPHGSSHPHVTHP